MIMRMMTLRFVFMSMVMSAALSGRFDGSGGRVLVRLTGGLVIQRGSAAIDMFAHGGKSFIRGESSSY